MKKSCLFYFALLATLPAFQAQLDQQHCGPDQFACRNGRCISRFLMCNGQDDCQDGSDEAGHCNDTSMATSKGWCPENQFRCKDERCIPKALVCDGKNDCWDASDERGCRAAETVTPRDCDGLVCGNDCVPLTSICDGELDCENGHDELNCGPDAFMNHSCLIEHGWFLCRGAKHRCLQAQRVCDGIVDCDFGMDEDGLCNKTTCSSISCEHGCVNTPQGPHCRCPLGFRMVDSKCVDIDECQVEPPLCSQQCVNTPGSYQCFCSRGYTLHDNHTCFADKPGPVLLVSTVNDIGVFYLRTNTVSRLSIRTSRPQSLEFYNVDNHLFWTDSSPGAAGIYKSTVDGYSVENVVSSGIGEPQSLAVDWVGHNIYFSDSYFKRVVVCDVTGHFCTAIIGTGLDKPRGVAVEPESRLLFWTDWGEEPHIGRSSMDGANPLRIITQDLKLPNSLAVDETIKRIFWCDAGLDRLESAGFDGSNRRVVHSLVSHPLSIDVFEDWIYWTDPGQHSVKRCNKFNGKHEQVLLSDSSFLGIRISHPRRQEQLPDPCLAIRCSHLRVLSSNSTSNCTCMCPRGMILASDLSTCQYNETVTSLVISSTSELFQLHPYQIGNDVTRRLPPHLLENVGALGYDQLTHSLVYSDIGTRNIHRLDLHTFNDTVLFSGTDAVEGLDVDDYSGIIYWTDAGLGTIVMGNPRTREALILARGLFHPTSIVLAPERGFLFAVEGRVNSIIAQWTMSCSSKNVIVSDHMGEISSLAYDKDAHALYWSDVTRGRIMQLDVTSGVSRTVKGHLGSPVAIGVTTRHLYWILEHSNMIYWTNKKTLNTVRNKKIDSAETRDITYRDLAVVEPRWTSNSSDAYACRSNGHCSHFCAPSMEGPVCLCPLGMTLSEDRKVCHSIVDCKPGYFRCSDGKCIPESFVCDKITDCHSLWSEEMNCNTSTAAACQDGHFRCGSGECIHLEFRCDGEFDCKDRSDEPEDCPLKECHPFKEFQCESRRQCIPVLAHCDGGRDCRDGSDEKDCPKKEDCGRDDFFCPRSKQCIPHWWRCNEDYDCEHGEDEENCTLATLSCPPDYIRCHPNDPCLPRVMLCNEVTNCDHESPEKLCRNLENATESRRAKERTQELCPKDQFSCFMSWGECVPVQARCNCSQECPLGEDEEGCPVSACNKDGFHCPGENRQIPVTWLCDGAPDCSNGEDEIPALCRVSTTEEGEPFPGLDIFVRDSCSDEHYTCKNGVCVAYNVLCDEHNDCIDNTDEGRNCSTSCTNNGGCPHDCLKTPEGPVCRCRPGYESFNKGLDCVDVNECEVADDCAQVCINTKGSYKCACANGYLLETDGRSCKVSEGRPFFLLSQSDSIERFYMDPPGRESHLGHLNKTHSPEVIKDIAFSAKGSTLYWISIQSSLLVSHNFNPGQVIYRFRNLKTSSMALDLVTGNVYVAGKADRGESHVRVWSPTSTGDAVVVRSSLVITDLALDPAEGLLFWSETSPAGSGRIRRSFMDGTGLSTVTESQKIIHPASLALDAIKERLYWADIHLESISSCDYRGNSYRVNVRNTYGIPLSLTFFENKLYWGCNDENVIHTAYLNSLTVASIPTDEAAHHIAVVHPVLEQQAFSNPCTSSPCGNGICLLAANASYNCLCPGDWKMESVQPFRCKNASQCPLQCGPSELCVQDLFSWLCRPADKLNIPEDSVEIPSSPGVTVASVMICLGLLTFFAAAGYVYYRRCRNSIGSPLKLRFRNALGLNEESIAWDDSVDYSDKRVLHRKGSVEAPPQVEVHGKTDGNRNSIQAPDSAYASQQSLARAGSAEQVSDSIPVSFPMRQKLLASEL